ncbi:MAG TPA: type II toxin-antitoxin system ParD family antitoxin [Candidatus Solibacter sp.]|nr:type II toxin-antitoxin system ParD family antitoxin [Candidatus Solibacter sp.]
MPTRNINLTPRFDRFIENGVSSGRYGNASEVVREGLRLLQQREQEERAKLAWLRGAVRHAIDQVERGEGIEFHSMADLERHINQIGGQVRRKTRR